MEDENLDFVLQFLSEDGAPSNSENFWNVEDSSVFEDPQHLQFDEDLVGGSHSDSGSSSLGLVLPEFSIENFQQQNSSMDYSTTAPAWFQATSHSKQQESKIPSSDDKVSSYWTTSSTTTTTPENSSTNSSSSSMEINDDNHPITAVTVPRDQLLSFTRADLDKFINEVTKGRSLTKEEKAEVSRQRRLIKNRKSAQASRERKRQKVEELEKKAQDLERSNSALRERFITLKAESQCMKDELHHLETMIRSNPVLSQLYDHAKLSKKQYNQTPEQSMATLSVIMAMTLTSMQVFCTAANYAAMAASNNQAISNSGQNGPNMEGQNATEKDDCVMEDPLTYAAPEEEQQQVDPSDSVSNKDSYAVDESTAAFCRSLLEEGRTEPSLPKQDASPYMLYTLLSPPPSPAYGIPLYCPCDGVMA